MIDASFWNPSSYLILPADAMVSFLSKLSEHYATHVRIMGLEISKELEIGYEASRTVSASSCDEKGKLDKKFPL
jgi:hypothetical protein